MMDFLKKNRLRVSLVFIIVFFLLYLATQKEEFRTENWFSASVQYIAYPFQASFHYIKLEISDAWTHYVWLVDVSAKNESLQKRFNKLYAENAENRETIIENRRLRNLLEFKEKDPNKKVFAEVILEITKPFDKILILNKGAEDGIRPNHAVVTSHGIVGKIQSVTAIQSVVQLITDPSSRFPVLIQRTRTKAMLFGSLAGKLKMKWVKRRLELFPDDLVITSGLAGIFPKGFPVGRIESINKKRFGLFQSVTLTPSADLDRIEEVAVILKNVYNIHQPLFTGKGQER